MIGPGSDKKFILTNRSRVNNPPILAQKQQKMAIFDKTDFWGLKYPPEVRVQHETCGTICGTPAPAILDHKNSTGSAGGAKNSQKWVFRRYKYSHFWMFLAPPADLVLALALEPKFHEDWCKNGHATRKKPKN